MKYKINIAEEFTKTPGGRYKEQSESSGEEFRDNILIPVYEKLKQEDVLIVNLDGTYGYPNNWLDEVFGGLAIRYNIKELKRKVVFRSREDGKLVDEIYEYINEKIEE